MRDFPHVEVTSRDDLRAWLQRHHTQTESIWLVTFKKSAGDRHVSYDAVVEEALCFGWVDSRPAKLDDERSMILLSPRRRASRWSARNKERITRLITDGRMHPAGLAKVEAAQRDGTWEALDAVEALEVPPDLAQAFAHSPQAESNFAAFPRSVRRGILERLLSAKRPETRAKRIAEIVRDAGENRRTGFERRR